MSARWIALFALFVVATQANAETCRFGPAFFNPPNPSVIDVYIDDSIWAVDQSPALTKDQAVHQIRVLLERFHSDTGADVTFRFKGLSTDVVCNGDPAKPFTTPTFVYKGGACEGSWGAIHNAQNCADITMYTRLPSCSTTSTGYSAEDYRGILAHETMHALGFAHTYDCPATYTRVNRLNSYGMQGAELLAGDINDLREVFGYDPGTIPGAVASGFAPAYQRWPTSVSGWTSLPTETPTNVISGVAVASTDDASRGMVWLAPHPTQPNGSWVHSLICDPTCVTGALVNLPTNTRPDIASSTGQATDRWMIAFLYGDEMTTTYESPFAAHQEKDLFIAERDHGSSSWSWEILPIAVRGSAVSVDYDPRSDMFIIAHTDGDGRVRFQLRPRTGGAWHATTPLYDVYSPAGASVACDETNVDANGRNCVLAWNDRSGFERISWLPFSIDASYFYLSMGPPVTLALDGSSKPQLVADPTPANAFLMMHSVFGDAVGARSKTVASSTWSTLGLSSLTVGGLGAGTWYRPAGVGTRVVNGSLRTVAVWAD